VEAEMTNCTFTAAVAALILAVGSVAPVAAEPFTDAAKALDKHDYASALRLLRPIAEQGNAQAQYNLGVMYDAGDGVPQDYAAAMSWWRKAAEQGYAKAQLGLGSMYFNGWGVLQDYVIAYMWYNLASAGGVGGGLDFITMQMTPAQIAEAQKLARDWKPTSTAAPH
jgi:TPR repeat protein